MGRLIKVGTRESKLAVAQTNWVVDKIKEKFPDYTFQLIKIKTKGDKILDKKLDKIGGKGLFIKELENALIDNSIDMAVHSMKDMPYELPEELQIAAISKREDPRDALISKGGKDLNELKQGAIVGTSSVRRETQILESRPDVKIKILRGNVITRLEKLNNGEYDAIVLAMAGLKRLKLENENVKPIDPKDMIPAVGQGALAVETKKDADIQYLIDSVYDEESTICVLAERAFLTRLNGNCSTPVGAHCIIEGGKLKMSGVYSKDGSFKVFSDSVEGSLESGEFLGIKLAEKILNLIG